MKTINFYQNENIIKLLAKYLQSSAPDRTNGNTDANTLADQFKKSVETLQTNTCRIPVLGTQGAGKSSFLNAILFDDIILPVDADETTCIPTEIHYGDSDIPTVQVVFKDNRRVNTDFSEDGLKKYVHQQFNPGNTMEVSHIEIAFKNDLLHRGIILVDLPGVGSITHENQKTTLDYIKKSSCAIFLIRSCPPITNSESIFIQGTLPLMSDIFWVQNQWTDESNEEVQDGCDQNERVLKKIAHNVHRDPETIQKPTVICVKRALDGRITENKQMLTASRLPDFLDKLVTFADNWRLRIHHTLHQNARELIQAAREKLNVEKERLNNLLKGETEEEEQKLKEKRDEHQQTLEQNQKIIDQAKKYYSQESTKLMEEIDSVCKKAAEDLRNNVRTVINGGVYGGQRLAQAFTDYRKEADGEIFKVLQQKFMDLILETCRNLEGIKDTLALQQETTSDYVSFTERSDSSQISKHVGTFAGGAGGTAAGAALGASIGSIVPGVGNIIGGIVGGLLGGLFGGYGGSKAAEKLIEQQRQRMEQAARQELFSKISEYENAMKELYKTQLKTFTKTMTSKLQEWQEQQQQMLDDEYRMAKKDFSKPAEDLQERITLLEKDLPELNRLQKEMETVE